jgi:acetyltransferase
VAGSSVAVSDSDVDELNLHFPVVAKIDHEEVIHKSDSGGVVLGIEDQTSLKGVVREMLERFPGARGVLIQEQVSGDIEVILGAKSDPVLGHIVLAGYGGIGVEIFRDVSISHVPFSRQRAGRMLEELKSYPLLKGYRGKPGVDIKDLEDLIMKMQQLLLDNPEIGEMDLNPLIFNGESFIVVDYRIKISE